jgi:hypothetical protein
VGYVRTTASPPYGPEHDGWWPDPILSFMGAVDVAAGDAQAFWVRVQAPRRQAAGRYRGRLEVLTGTRVLRTLDLTVEVYPFAVPVRTPLPLAITFWPEYVDRNGVEGAHPDRSWQRHRLEWADFLADYYLTYDCLYDYRNWSPDFEVLTRLHRQGRLGWFNLGYFGPIREGPEGLIAWESDSLHSIRPAYDQAKALGLLDHAYLYGCDEQPEAMFPAVQRAAERLKRECPGPPIITTTYDYTFGTNSVLRAVDAFCPLTPAYSPAVAAQARAAGKQVWWYIACNPSRPYANMFVDYPALDGRVLMGAQTAKFRPDGFLYYQVSMWYSPRPITSGPFTDWVPYHGDGNWVCAGPDGTPLPTIRLENFRDGLEDYAYARLLEQAIRQVEGSPSLRTARAAWLTRARAALEVPAGLTRSMTEYTHDPAEVYRWRRGMAQAIAESGVEVSLP